MENKTLRTFFATPISAACRQEINKVVQKLEKDLPSEIRWVNIKKLHITLKFLGEFKSNDIELIKNRLESVFSTTRQFDLKFQNLGVFPNERRPKVVWIGIASPAQLKPVFEEIEKATLGLGYPNEVRGFSPHITIGRVKNDKNNQGLLQVAKVFQNMKFGEICKSHVEGIAFIQSKLTPAGPLYSELFSIGFKQ